MNVSVSFSAPFVQCVLVWYLWVFFCIKNGLFSFQSVVQNTVQFCVVIIPHCVFQVIINLIVTSSLTLTVADQDSGETHILIHTP